jgi:tetratricopeptide (TPR) repeat protein
MQSLENVNDRSSCLEVAMTINSIELGRKTVILAVVASVAVMFVTSFVYRMNNPNLFVQVKQQQTTGDGHDHGDNPAPPPGMGQGGMSQIKTFMDAVEKNPNDVESLINLGNAFLMMRAWDRALEPLEKANSLQPGNVNVLKSIGIAHFNKEDFVGASKAYDQILEVKPDDTLALFNLGVIFKYYFEKPDQAQIYFEKVLNLEKEDAELIKMAKQELSK